MTISFNHLGFWGRLGNQMFQYSTLKSIAKKHGYSFTIPPSSFSDPYKEHQLFEAFELESLPQENIRLNNTEKILQESFFHFDEDLYNQCPDNIDLFGYFQSEKYFVDIRDEILKDFTFLPHILGPAKEMRDEFGDEVISLHIRRGDYVEQPWHGPQNTEYYAKALKMLPEEIPVLIFTDDPPWAFEQELFESDRFCVSEGNSNLFDMCLMSMCQYHIIANSSFSWWGAWLSDSKQVIAPKRWFGPPLDERNDTKDLVPSGWKRI
jgi:hypothetical protein|tara:strand:+ start:291 stop:1085 length:795 start_codon:yes stop_codon:yes gene_type:complete